MYQYPFIYHRVIHFQDTDAAGVVYFANLLSMCHEAYEAWLGTIGINLKEFFRGNPVAIPIVHAAVDFLQPMFCGETYAIHLTPVQLSSSKFQISYAIFSTALSTADRATDTEPLENDRLVGQRVGQATTIHVCIDPRTRTRADLPSQISQQLQPQEKL